MKINPLYLISFMIIISFLFCGKQDESDIIGSWVMYKKSKKSCTDPSQNTDNNLIISTIPCEGDQLILCEYLSYEFTTNSVTRNTSGVIFGIRSNRTLEGNYIIQNEKLTLCFEKADEIDCNTYDFSLKRNKLILTQHDAQNGCIKTSRFQLH